VALRRLSEPGGLQVVVARGRYPTLAPALCQYRGLKSIGEDGPVHFRAYERPVEITWRFEHEDPREVVSMQVKNGEMLVQPIAPTVGRCSVRRVCGPLPRRVAQN
jgi:hypothetical protein